MLKNPLSLWMMFLFFASNALGQEVNFIHEDMPSIYLYDSSLINGRNENYGISTDSIFLTIDSNSNTVSNMILKTIGTEISYYRNNHSEPIIFKRDSSIYVIRFNHLNHIHNISYYEGTKYVDIVFENDGKGIFSFFSCDYSGEDSCYMKLYEKGALSVQYIFVPLKHFSNVELKRLHPFYQHVNAVPVREMEYDLKTGKIINIIRNSKIEDFYYY